MKTTAVYKWLTRFSAGRESVTDKERSGRPATSRNEENIGKVCRLTARIIAEQANIDRETVREILSEDLEDLDREKCVQEWPQRTCSHVTVCEGVFSY
jgi:transposase